MTMDSALARVRALDKKHVIQSLNLYNLNQAVNLDLYNIYEARAARSLL